VGKKWRPRTTENVIKEIKYLKENYGIKEFHIWDDNFTLDKKTVLKFCDLLIKEKINLDWWCPNGLRLETLDEELLKKMKETGFYAMALGIESGSEKIQKDMKKNLDFKKLEEVIKIADKLKIRCQGFFILGYPTETKEDILKTINLAKKLRLYRAAFLLFHPLVGSEVYEHLKKQKKILCKYSTFDAEFQKPSILLQGLKNKQELKKLQRKAYLSFYLRPKIFFRFLIDNLHPSRVKSFFILTKKYILEK